MRLGCYSVLVGFAVGGLARRGRPPHGPSRAEGLLLQQPQLVHGEGSDTVITADHVVSKQGSGSETLARPPPSVLGVPDAQGVAADAGS